MVKNKLAEAYLSLAREKPLSQITIQEICDKANFSRRTFYNHFEDKNAVTGWIYYQQLGNAFDYAINNFKNLEECFVDAFDRMLEERDFYRAAYTDSSKPSLKDYQYHYTYEVYKQVIDLDDLDATDKESFIFSVRFYCHGAVEAVQHWLTIDTQKSSETFASHMVQALPQEMKVRLPQNNPFYEKDVD